MMKYLIISCVCAIVVLLFSGCREWIEFDFKRMVYPFVITLAIGIVGLALKAIFGGNKNNNR